VKKAVMMMNVAQRVIGMDRFSSLLRWRDMVNLCCLDGC
jgi:hypothetical protein